MTAFNSNPYKFRSYQSNRACYFSSQTFWIRGLKVLFLLESKQNRNGGWEAVTPFELRLRHAKLCVCLACLTPTCSVFALALCSLLSSTLHLAMPEIAEFSILKVRLRSQMENFKEKARQKLFCVRGFFDIFIYDGKLSIFTDRFHIFLQSLILE